MSRGTKLELGIGASFEEGWALVDEAKQNTHTIKSPKEHTLTFQKEKRRGKPVTVVGTFFLEKKEAQQLLKRLKSALACGGTYKDGLMEFQGDVQQRLKELLAKEGFTIKNRKN